MNLFQIISYPLFLFAALEILLGAILLWQNSRNSPVNRTVAVFSFFTAAFAAITALMYLLASHGRDITLLARANWIGWLMIPAALQFIFYMRDENSRAARIAGLILYPFWFIVFCVSVSTELVERGNYTLMPYIDRSGPLGKPLRILGIVQLFWLLYEIFRLRRQLSGIKRAQLNYFTHGLLIFVGGGTIVAGILQLFGGFGLEPGLGSFFSLPWVVLTFYAITRYRLFDLPRIISRAVSIGLLSVFFAVVQMGIFKLLEPALGPHWTIVVSLALMGFVFFGSPFSRMVQEWVQNIILQDRYEYQRILKEAINSSVSILDQHELLDYLVKSIKKNMGVVNVCLYLTNSEGCNMKGHGTGIYQDICRNGLLDAAVIAWVKRAGQLIIREELVGILPDEEIRMVAYDMKRIGAELIIPLLYKGDARGFIVLGPKSNREPYLQSDLDILESLAGHASVAIENARLYEEARRVQESFLESEAKFRTLAETAATAIFIHQGGNFLYVNRAAEIVGGYTCKEYLAMNFMGLAHPDYANMIKARARERLAGGQPPPQYEFKIIKKGGEERWVLMTAGVTEFEGKSTVIGTLIDITSRKNAEEEQQRLYAELEQAKNSLEESEARFRTLAETTTAGIFIHRGGKFIYANPAGEEFTGYSKDEFLSMDFWDIIHPDYRELVRERGRARLGGARLPQKYEFKIITKTSEERWVIMTAGVIEYERRPAIIGTLFDITDRKRAEEEQARLFEANVRQYQEKIAVEKRHQMEKEKILRDLHDGIGGITSNISLLADLAQNATSVPEIKKKLCTISELSRDGIAEIRSFLHSLDSRDITWHTLTAELRNQGSSMVSSHGISFDISTVIGDVPEQPGSLLCMNLFRIYKEALTNIIKHSRARSVRARLRVDPDRLELLVQDDGIGMEKGRRGGRGLLNMRARAEEIGGRLTMTTGQGTCMTLEIPIPLKYPVPGIEQHEPL